MMFVVRPRKPALTLRVLRPPPGAEGGAKSFRIIRNVTAKPSWWNLS